jgi:hypothetical protein
MMAFVVPKTKNKLRKTPESIMRRNKPYSSTLKMYGKRKTVLKYPITSPIYMKTVVVIDLRMTMPKCQCDLYSKLNYLS